MTPWQDILEAIKPQVTDHVFRTYIEPIRPVTVDGDRLVLGLPSKFLRDWVADHYADFLGDVIGRAEGRGMALEIVEDPQASGANGATVGVATASGVNGKAITPSAAAAAASERTHGRPLNEKYTFGTFVSGSSNQFAHAACQAVAEHPASNYNPLFVFGGVGLGKTHLLNAIGLQIHRQHPDWNIHLLSAETFTNEVIYSIREHRMDELRRKYREQCDVLLIDDIQFLAGKDRTQEEFFHTFNNLYETKRQIVVTSDKLPHEIPDLEERLSSRFQWGLIADIQPPELETRVAILEKKAELDGILLPEDVAMFLATHIKSNVRELEGSLIRLEAFASLTGQHISVELAKDVLKDVLAQKAQKPDPEHIQRVVASHYNVSVKDVLSHRRTKQITGPRQVAMFLCRKLTDLSLPEIGKVFGGRDHSTVLAAVRKIERDRNDNLQLRQTLDHLERSLTP